MGCYRVGRSFITCWLPGDATAKDRSHGPGRRPGRAAKRNGHTRNRRRGNRCGAGPANGRGHLSPDTGQFPGPWKYRDFRSYRDLPADAGANACEQPAAQSNLDAHADANAHEQPAAQSYIDASSDVHACANDYEQPAAQSYLDAPSNVHAASDVYTDVNKHPYPDCC